MYKKTSTIMGLAIATILIAYISALTLSNQAFAQMHAIPRLGDCGASNPNCQANTKVIGQELTQGIKAQVGKVLAGLIHPGLGCSPLDPRGC